MADVDELFNCFDDDNEEKQTAVPIVLDVPENTE